MNIIYSKNSLTDFEIKIKKYFETMIISTKRFDAIILYFNVGDEKIMILDKTKNKWNYAKPEDKNDVDKIIEEKEKLLPYNKIVGFISYDKNPNNVVFKTKHTDLKRNTGAICQQAGKDKKIKNLNDIFGYEKYNKENTKGMVDNELCSLQEFVLRKYQKDRKNDKTWFLNLESALINKL